MLLIGRCCCSRGCGRDCDDGDNDVNDNDHDDDHDDDDHDDDDHDDDDDQRARIVQATCLLVNAIQAIQQGAPQPNCTFVVPHRFIGTCTCV